MLQLPHHHRDDDKTEHLEACLQRVEHFQTVSELFRQLSAGYAYSGFYATARSAC